VADLEEGLDELESTSISRFKLLMERMQPWTSDAKDIGEIYEDELVITPSIREFVHPDDRDRIFYVVAPKGIGKSLFLIYKRQLYDAKYKKSEYGPKKEEIYLIPKDLPVDRCLDITRSTLTKEKIELLSDHMKCKQLWKFCISLSIIKNIIKFYKPKYLQDLKEALDKLLNKMYLQKDLVLLMKDEETINPSDHFVSILKFGFGDIIKAIEVQSDISKIIKNNIRSGVAVFIDNVDQSFDDYLRSEDVHFSELSKSIWYTSQIGLIFAVYDLSAMNSHIKVFVSVRKEAFQKMRKIGSLGSQIRGEALDIAYTANQLKEIFIKNILIMEEKDLAISRDKENNPLHAFLGLDSNEIMSINGVREDIFCYIHRHSLKRPRDLMTIGRSLKLLEKGERNTENIKKAVNSAAYEISTDFLAEIHPFTDIDFDRLFGLMHSNVLSRNEIRDICGEYNQKHGCNDEDCDKCDMVHVFCGLYKFGLLGTVIRDLIDKDRFMQKFVQIGDVDYDEKVLPNSDYYLTHPALISKIDECNSRFRKTFNPVSTIIIGDGYRWKNPFENSDCEVTAKDQKTKKKNKFWKFFITEFYGLSAKRVQKDGQEGKSEADSKTLVPLKDKLSDLVASSREEIRWLDVGCGNGRCLEILDEIKERDNIFYHGVDSVYNLDVAAKKAESYGIKSYLERLYAESLNFESKYDLISSILLLHEADPLKLPHILRNLIKALKDNGELIISDFQEPYELEENIVVWSSEDIKFVLDNICVDARADFFTVPSDEYPSEFLFYFAFIKKSSINDSGFDEFFNNYDNFLTTKKDKLATERDSLRRQMNIRVNEILGKNNTPTMEELEDVEEIIEEEYVIKGFKAYLLTRQIEFLENKLKEFSK
jgi:SAM-dependent methyltransferase